MGAGVPLVTEAAFGAECAVVADVGMLELLGAEYPVLSMNMRIICCCCIIIDIISCCSDMPVGKMPLGLERSPALLTVT